MDDQLWQELLESPYEKKRKPKEAPSGPQRPLIGLTVGIAVAVVVGGGAGWWLAPEAAEVTAPTTTVTAPPTTQPAAIGEPGFLPGFSELGGTAFAPVVQFTVGDKTYIAVSEIVHSDSDRAATQPTAIGRYQFPTPDGAISATRDITAISAPGVRLVEFDAIVGDESLVLDLGTNPVFRSSCPGCNPFLPDDDDEVFGFSGFPMQIDDPSLAIDLGANGSIVFDRIVLDDEWGVVDWHVASDSGLIAQVDLYAFFLGTETAHSDGSVSGPAALIPLHEQGPRFGQATTLADPGMSEQGSIQLSRTGPHITSENQPTVVAIRWEVTWTTPSGESTSLVAAHIR